MNVSLSSSSSMNLISPLTVCLVDYITMTKTERSAKEKPVKSELPVRQTKQEKDKWVLDYQTNRLENKSLKYDGSVFCYISPRWQKTSGYV